MNSGGLGAGRLSITDAQIHAWAPDSESHPWPQRGREYVRTAPVASSAERPPFSAAELVREMDRVGVDRAILVPPVFAGDENSTALAAAHKYPGRFAVMGRLSLDDPRSPERLRGWREDPAMVGVRQTFFWKEHQRLLDEGRADWFWAQAEEMDIPVAVLSPGRLPTMGEIARRHPGLRLIIDHFGMDLGLKDASAFAALDDLLPLARFPNVAVKASTLPSYVSDPYPFKSLHEPIRRVVDAFGPQRVFWGSEMTRLPCSYEECVTLFTRELGFLSHDDLVWVMGRGIREWLGLAGGNWC